MTSSDVLDTCFNLQLRQSGNIILNDIEEVSKSIKNKHSNTSILYVWKKCGIHAEPTTFGLKLITFYAEF